MFSKLKKFGVNLSVIAVSLIVVIVLSGVLGALLVILNPATGDIVGIPGLLLICLVTLIASPFSGLGAVIGTALQAMIRRQ